jgi:hypothetical protein
MKRSMMAVMAFAGVLGIAASTALAAGNTFYSGQMCQWRWPGNGGHQYTQYGIWNSNSGNYDDVFCPLTYDIPSTGSYSPEKYDAVHIHVYDGSTSGNVDCSVEEVNWDGSVHVSSDQYTTNAFTGVYTLNFTSPIPLTNQYPISGSLYCHLGANSTIYGYDLSFHEQ